MAGLKNLLWFSTSNNIKKAYIFKPVMLSRICNPEQALKCLNTYNSKNYATQRKKDLPSLHHIIYFWSDHQIEIKLFY